MPFLSQLTRSSVNALSVAACLLSTGLATPVSAMDEDPDYSQPSENPVNNDPPMLGVQMTNTTAAVARQQDLTPGQGVLVRDVYSDTAADQLGILPGDVITNINGSPIGSMSDLRTEVLGSDVGSDVSVLVRRNGEDVALSGARYNAWPEDIP